MAQILVWAKAKTGDFAPGDIVDVLPDGMHVGRAILRDGEPWDGAVRADSDFIVLDFDAGKSVRQSIRNFVAEATGGAVPDLRTLNRFLAINWQTIPTSVRQQLLADRRRSITLAQFRNYITLRDGVTLQDIRDEYDNTIGRTA